MDIKKTSKYKLFEKTGINENVTIGNSSRKIVVSKDSVQRIGSVSKINKRKSKKCSGCSRQKTRR